MSSSRRKNLFDIEVSPGSKMLLCLPAVAFGTIISFSLGLYLGRLWGTFLHKESQKQMRPETEEAQNGKSTVKEPGKTRKPREKIGESDRKGDLTVFLTKSGTKVHFVKDCLGLASADMTQIKEISICKHCLKRPKSD